MWKGMAGVLRRRHIPCNRTTIGIRRDSFLAASIMPWAMTSHLIIPPNMFTKIALTYKRSDRTIVDQ